MRSLNRLLARTLIALTLPGAAVAAYPSQPVRLVVGFPPGTGPDIIARTLGQEMSRTLGQNVVVENRAGAGGQIAAQHVARAAPDGHTVLLGEIGSLGIAPAAYESLSYDPVRELAPVTEAVRSDFVLVVPTGSPHRDVASFVKSARESQGKVNFATFGAATPGHFGAGLFARTAGFAIEPVHYRSTGDAVTALVSGDVQAGFITTAMAAQQIAGGKMRALATTGTQRAANLPETPTLAESGMPDVVFQAWMSLMVPAGTPAEAIDTLQRSAAQAMQVPAVRKQLDELGFAVVGSSSAELGAHIKNEISRWRVIVRETGFKP